MTCARSHLTIAHVEIWIDLQIHLLDRENHTFQLTQRPGDSALFLVPPRSTGLCPRPTQTSAVRPHLLPFSPALPTAVLCRHSSQSAESVGKILLKRNEEAGSHSVSERSSPSPNQASSTTPCCVTLGKPTTLSGPGLPHLEYGDNGHLLIDVL